MTEVVNVAVLGDPIAHSRSPAMHGAAFAELGIMGCCVPLRVPRGELGGALTALGSLGFAGASVTLPLKGEALALAGSSTEEARWRLY